MNLPNKLTLLRIFMIIPFVIIMAFAIYFGHNDNKNYMHYMLFAAGGVFIVAMLTDFVDGYLARKNNQITTFGKLFDPLADKFMTTSAFITLSILGIVPFWLTLIFVLRDILVDGSRNLAAANDVKVAASIYGKIKTLIQTIGLTLILFLSPIFVNNIENPISPTLEIWLLNIPLFIAALFSLISGFLYIKQIKPLLKIK